MSLYADYVRERTNDLILETDNGFATYRYVYEENAVYILDIYVRPEVRKEAEGRKIADAICAEAITKSMNFAIGSVSCGAKNSIFSISVLIAYDMELWRVENGMIYFRKVI